MIFNRLCYVYMKDRCHSIYQKERVGEEKILDYPQVIEEGGKKRFFANKNKLCLIQQKEGQHWILHVFAPLEMSTDVMYFFSVAQCY